MTNGEQIKIYLGKILADIDLVFLLAGTGQSAEKINELWNYYKPVHTQKQFNFLRLVDQVDSADFILMHHNYFTLKKRLGEKFESYLSELINLAQKSHKKIIILAMADSDESIDIPEAIIFRFSQYRYKKQPNEIMIPFYLSPTQSTEGKEYKQKVFKEIILRNKTVKPVVSFCGWAGFPTTYRWFTYQTKVFLLNLKSRLFFNPNLRLHRPGIYFRRRAIAVLKKAKKIDANFIIRKSYSAQNGMDGRERISPEQAEKEYLESMINSDFVLCPKGNGNGSIRFYETLALGRFPVLIDTDCILPLADTIDYSQFVVLVDWKNIEQTPEAILNFYNAISELEINGRQKLARNAFNELRPENLFRHHLRVLINN